MTVVSSTQKILPVALLQRFRDATSAAYEAQKDSSTLWRLAELDRALGNLSQAGQEFGAYAEQHPEHLKPKILSDLLAGTGSSRIPPVDGVVPFVLVHDLAPEPELVKIRKAIEDRRDQFAIAMIGHKDKQQVDVNYRSAVYVRGDQAFREMTRGFFRTIIQEHNILIRLGLGEISGVKEEIEAIAYTTGGKYAIHRDNAPHIDNGRLLTAVWFVHDEPKGFSGGDLLLHDEPPAGEGFTRIIPHRNSAVFFPSVCLHEVTPVESMVENVLSSRMVLNNWFHRAEA